MGFLSSFVENMCFKPDSQQYWKPEHYALRSIPFSASGSQERRIDGVVIPAQAVDGVRRPQTVVYFEPGICNREFNLPQAVHLAAGGFDLIVFDYSGFGISPGTPSIDGLLADAEAVFEWLDASSFKKPKYVLFGQGLGADAALQYCHAHPGKVEKLILESAYADRRAWLKERWGPVIGDIAARVLPCAAIEPEDALQTVKMPTLLIYPEKDTFVRGGQRKRMTSNLRKNVTVWAVPGARHLRVFTNPNALWSKKLREFIAR